jgi:hypothetical protein
MACPTTRPKGSGRGLRRSTTSRAIGSRSGSLLGATCSTCTWCRAPCGSAKGRRCGRGQVIGLLGNSGNTSTLHLHFQVSDRPGFAPVDSLPYVFDRFAFLGQITDELSDENLALRPTGELAFAPSGSPRVLRQEMPLDRNVLRLR